MLSSFPSCRVAKTSVCIMPKAGGFDLPPIAAQIGQCRLPTQVQSFTSATM